MTSRYEILEPIGRGGHGTVYRARRTDDGDFQKTVALKLLDSRDPEVLRRFRDEARLLGLLQHRAIVGCEGLVQLDGRAGLVMELVRGPDLGVLRALGPVPPRPALQIAAEIADGLGAARELEVVHRDLKPGNVALTAAGEVKILDFGVARAAFDHREALTRAQRYGTRPYMAPERLEGDDGPAGDVYALGVMLFELLTAALPARRAGGLDPNPEAWAALRARCPRAELLIRAMLAVEAEDRPPVEALAIRLERLAREQDGPDLRAWAAEAVPRALAARPPVTPDALTGVTLSQELSTTLTTIPLGLSARSQRARRWGIALSFAVALVAGAAVVGANAARETVAAPDPGHTELPVQPPPVVEPVQASEPDPPVEAPRIEAAPVLTPAPARRVARPSSARPSIAPAPPVDEPAPSPAAPTAVELVTSESCAAPAEIVLVQGALRQAPGPVEPGLWSIEARFSAADALAPAGSVRVSEGQTAALCCSARRRVCR